jgi:hypothetical protein
MKRFITLCGICTLLTACASWQQGSGTAAGINTPRTAFERQELDRARQLVLKGDLAEAAWRWDVLTALRPDVPDYAEQLSRTRLQIERTVAEMSIKARQARQRGALDEATQYNLAVLALNPDDATAADALRAIERERNERDYLNPLKPGARKPTAAR